MLCSKHLSSINKTLVEDLGKLIAHNLLLSLNNTHIL